MEGRSKCLQLAFQGPKGLLDGCTDRRKPGRITIHGNCPFPQASARMMAESLEGVKTRRRLDQLAQELTIRR